MLPPALTQTPLLQRFFPFLTWLPVSGVLLRGDLIAGITGALVLVPKAMAYAQLSGLPVHFGLYVAFIPAILGALWGSSRQLATGPVAVVSLMTAAALTPLAVPFSDDYVALALLLTLMVGIIQFALGVLKLGVIVNFVSHPVILGFMNAAAVIIALSQLDLLLGIPKSRGTSWLLDTWEMLSNLPLTDLPTLAMSAFALALMLLLKRIKALSQLSVLIAVGVTIVVSHLLSYEQRATLPLERIADTAVRAQLSATIEADQRMRQLSADLSATAARLRQLPASDQRSAAALRHQVQVTQIDIHDLAHANQARLQRLYPLRFERVREPQPGAPALYLTGTAPVGADISERRWRIAKLEGSHIQISGGGDVVGDIPQGLPEFRVPTISLDGLLALLSVAAVIALVAFMESIAMAKAIAAKTHQRIDPNQELIGQGLANLGGAFFQSYPACGSFTGSAINLQAGAKTGFAMVFNGLFVMATLLFLTPYLYALPKATLGAIILLAITSLITPAALRQTWRASRSDGLVALTTFAVTIVAAPHLDRGILIGAALAVLLYLYRTMRPRVAQLARHEDGGLRDLQVYPLLPSSDSVIVLRFDDSLYFANAAFFEDAVLEAVARKPQVKYLLVVGTGINQMDASGEEVVRHLVERLREGGVCVVFSGVKKQVLDVMRRTGLYALIGERFMFPNDDQALAAIHDWAGDAAQVQVLLRQSNTRSTP